MRWQAAALLVALAAPCAAAPSYRVLSDSEFERRMAESPERVHPASLTRAQAVADLEALERALAEVWRGRWNGGSGAVSVAWILPKAEADLPKNGPVAFSSFTEICGAFVNTLRDSHLYLMRAGDELGDVSEPAAPLRWQKLADGLGLIRVDRFPETGEPFGAAFSKTVDRAFRGLRNTPGLILDLRGNAGGDPNQYDRFFDYLASSQVVLYTEVVRRSAAMESYLGPEKVARWTFEADGFSRPFPFLYDPQDPGFKYKGKVLLLVDGGTVSAGEYLAAGLLDNGFARAAGERTRGHTGSVVPVELPYSKLVVAIPIQHVLRRDGSSLQDRGILPRYPLDTTSPRLLENAENVLEAWIHAST